ncbi:MAG: glycosyltransferase [bacterium]
MRASIIIPTYNRPNTLKLCLEALSRQTANLNDFEVIVVKDGREIELVFSDLTTDCDPGLQVRFFEIDHAGPGVARNAGIDHAAGEIICFTDDDCVPERTWVQEWLKYFVEHPDKVAAGGLVNSVSPTTMVERYIALKGLLARPVVDPTSAILNLVTANAAGRKVALQAIGGFDSDYLVNGKMVGAEDLDLTHRLRERFGNTALGTHEPAQVAHHHRQTLSALVRQHVAYGMGAGIFLKKFNLPPSHLSIKQPTILGLGQYAIYLLDRIAKKGFPEFKRKHLPIYLYPLYGGLDFVRKFAYMWGFYKLSLTTPHGKR